MTPAKILAEQVFAALPQTQCTRCGFPDCQAYASAIANDGVAINQCSPGGAEGIVRLSKITGQAVQPLNPENGVEGPRSVAFIDENWCIGCTLCIDVCPTDAIIGSNKLMHTVIEPHCTGCELCLPVCPVDCIELENVTGERTGWAAWSAALADQALNRYTAHQKRYAINSGLDNKYAGYSDLLPEKTVLEFTSPTSPTSPTPNAPVDTDNVVINDKNDKSAVIAAVLAKARAKQAGKKP